MASHPFTPQNMTFVKVLGLYVQVEKDLAIWKHISHPVMFKESFFHEKVSREHEGSVSLGCYSALSPDCTQTQTAERGRRE